MRSCVKDTYSATPGIVCTVDPIRGTKAITACVPSWDYSSISVERSPRKGTEILGSHPLMIFRKKANHLGTGFSITHQPADDHRGQKSPRDILTSLSFKLTKPESVLPPSLPPLFPFFLTPSTTSQPSGTGDKSHRCSATDLLKQNFETVSR